MATEPILLRPGDPVDIRRCTSADWPQIWAMLEPVIRAGETYALDSDMKEEDARAYWLAAERKAFVAEARGVLVGTYYLRQNQAGGGSHVANCGYVTSNAATGRGVGRSMCMHSIEHARSLGLRAMQFNFVVSTNQRAIRLWESLGFLVVGRLPKAFNHPTHGFVDALVMFSSFA